VPSDCQKVCTLLSRSWSTPLPDLALDSVHTASPPISRFDVSSSKFSVRYCGASSASDSPLSLLLLLAGEAAADMMVADVAG
jgi:hypothetical protein